MVEKKGSTTEKVSKRLSRSKKDRIVGGVAGGLGEFFEVDSTIIRLIFVLVTIFGGSGVLLYLILWLVIPSSSRSISNRTIKSNAEEIKEQAEGLLGEVKEGVRSDKARRFLGIVTLAFGLLLLFNNFGVFRFVFQRLWPLILIVLGFTILLKD